MQADRRGEHTTAAEDRAEQDHRTADALGSRSCRRVQVPGGAGPTWSLVRLVTPSTAIGAFAGVVSEMGEWKVLSGSFWF